MYKVKHVKTNFFYVDENGSMAVIKNVLYINGVKADDGSYQIETEEGNFNLLVVDGMVTIDAE